MDNLRFFICDRCKNIVTFMSFSGMIPACCGDPMSELLPGAIDAAKEKHVPVIKVEGSKVMVTVGSTAHPMTAEHYIQWIIIQTENGTQRKELKPGDAPTAEFALVEGDKAMIAYAYCNLHGLWRTEI